MREPGFTTKTFAYFDDAHLRATDRDWFDEHQSVYAEHVEAPLTHLVMHLREQLSPLLPGIEFAPRKISKPLSRAPQKGPAQAVVRDKATAFFAEPATSMFEMNPGIYLSLGSLPEDNVYGCGIYMPTSRQLRALRPRLYADLESFESVLCSAAMRKHWSGLAGERYKRFPKDCDIDGAAAQYAWHKQFFVGKDLSRDEVIHPGFISRVVAAFKAAAPFLTWTRQAVGVYQRPATLTRRSNAARHDAYR